jgi:hypothetical protein
MTDKKAGTEIAASGPILENNKGFHRSKQNLYIYFSLRLGTLKI